MPGRYNLYPFQIGEVLQLKKQHPCGGWQWLVERIGADIGLKCLTCSRFMVLPRQKLEKAVKTVLTEADRAAGPDPANPPAGSKNKTKQTTKHQGG